MEEASVETGVDQLVQFLERHGKKSLKEVSNKLKIPEETLQLWVDFLVEERILGIEYKFTKPYIFLNEKDKAKSVTLGIEETDEESASIEVFKQEFFERAKTKQLPDSKIPLLWQAHLKEAINKQKDFFLREANNRDLKNAQTLFEEYTERLMHM